MGKCIKNIPDVSENYQKIREFLKKEYSSYYVYPPMELIFNAFKLTPYGKVKAVILGQDPYHEYGQAHGLSFSVTQGTPMPPSLKNIYKELKSDLGVDNGSKTDLTAWAKEGVLLLNATLTVRDGQANSHAKCGWAEFTDEVIKRLSDRHPSEKEMILAFSERIIPPYRNGLLMEINAPENHLAGTSSTFSLYLNVP